MQIIKNHKKILVTVAAIILVFLCAILFIEYNIQKGVVIVSGCLPGHKGGSTGNCIGDKTEKSNALNNDILNWKTYTSSKYGFEFKYPANLSVAIDNGFISVGDHENKEPTSGSGMMWRNQQFVIEPLISKTSQSKFWNEPTSDRLVSKQDVNINGSLVTMYEVESVYGRFLEGNFENNNQVFYFHAFNGELTNQILSTFKFTNK